MVRWYRPRLIPATLGVAMLALTACSASSAGTASGGTCTPSANPVVTLAAYSNPYAAYGKLISTWQSEWKDAHDGQLVQFLASFGGSTTQAQSIVNGLGADIFAASTGPDVELVQNAGLITNDWQNAKGGSIVQSGSVVFAVRPGNPKHIENWNDLTQPGLQILTPDPAQSGGARWNIVAAYGAAMRGEVPGYTKNDPAEGQRLLEGIFKNVTVMDKSANDSLKNFQSGNGDVAISYENQILLSKASGTKDQLVLPPSTVLVQNPTVVVDKNAQKHCVLPIANAFVSWLHTSKAQAILGKVGYFRPVNLAQARRGISKLGQQPVNGSFTVDQVGGWNQLLNDTVFGPSGAFTRALKAAKG